MGETVSAIRRRNLRVLADALGAVQALADAIERSQSQVSQLLNQTPHSKTGRPRVMADTLARHIEGMLRLETGWMDVPHAGEPAPLFPPEVTRRVRNLKRAPAAPPTVTLVDADPDEVWRWLDDDERQQLQAKAAARRATAERNLQPAAPSGKRAAGGRG